MSNEELVTAYRQGDPDAIEKLWLQVRDFIAMKASIYLEKCQGEDKGIQEDLIQQAYFSLVDAADRYSEDRGASFLTYLSKCLSNSFREVLFSGRGNRLENDPLNTALSLDKPLFENESGIEYTLADILSDKQEGEQIEYTTDRGFLSFEDADYWRSVNVFLKQCLNEYGTEIGAAVLSYMMDHDCTLRDAVLALYGEDVRSSRKTYSKYNYHVHNTKIQIRKRLQAEAAKNERTRRMMDELFIGSFGLRDTGLRCFRETGLSSVERAVFCRNDFQNKSRY